MHFCVNAKGRKIWDMALAAIWWSHWLERNNKVFENAVELSYQVFKRAKNVLLSGLEDVKIGIMTKGMA